MTEQKVQIEMCKIQLYMLSIVASFFFVIFNTILYFLIWHTERHTLIQRVFIFFLSNQHFRFVYICIGACISVGKQCNYWQSVMFCKTSNKNKIEFMVVFINLISMLLLSITIRIKRMIWMVLALFTMICYNGERGRN